MSMNVKRMKHYHRSTRPFQGYGAKNGAKGLTILDVLISIVLTVVGVYSAVVLQIANSTGNQSATNRVKAVWYVNDIAERIRSNPEGGVQGFYEYDSTAFSAGTMCLPAAAGCTAQEMANYDLYYWDSMIKGSETTDMHMHSFLPQVQANITNMGNGTYEISVSWDDMQHNGNGATLNTFTVEQTIRFFSDDDIAKYTP